MIAQLKDAFRKARENPRHLWYFLQNVNILRDHFPQTWRKLCERRSLNLGGPREISSLHVILRTTDSVESVNSSRQLESTGIRCKHDVIRMGGCSLFPAARKFMDRFGADRLSITIVADRLSDSGLALYRNAASKSNVSFDMIDSKGAGNGPSFQTQIDIALADNDDTLVFILEDDYLLDTEVLTIGFELMRAHSGVGGFNPHFHPDRVRRQDIGLMAALDGRLYCRIPSTCCTFFMAVADVRRFKTHLRLYNGWEKGSIGHVWRKSICLAPLGWTLAEHLHRNELSPVQRLLPCQEVQETDTHGNCLEEHLRKEKAHDEKE